VVTSGGIQPCLRDDAARTALATLLSQVAPAEVLVCRVGRGAGGRVGAWGGVSAAAKTALAKCPCKPRVTQLTAGEEFPLNGEDADVMLAACERWSRGTGGDGSGSGGSGGGGSSSGGGSGDGGGDVTMTTAATTSAIASPEVAGAAPAARAAAAALASHLRRLKCAAPLAAAEVRTHAVYARGGGCTS
jgi:hypothetical protein